jgi:hypothetical protein
MLCANLRQSTDAPPVSPLRVLFCKSGHAADLTDALDRRKAPGQPAKHIKRVSASSASSTTDFKLVSSLVVNVP